MVAIVEAWPITGPAKNLLGFAHALQKQDEKSRAIDLSIAAYQRGRSPEGPFMQAVRQAGIPLHILHEKRRFDASVPEQIRRIVEEEAIDVIQTHSHKSHFFLRWSGLWKSHPWIAFHHGFTAEDLKMRLYNQTVRWSLRAAHQVVTVCGPFAEQLVKVGIPRERIQVQHNSIEPFLAPSAEIVTAARAQIKAAANTRLLVAVGRLSREKGHADLLRAFAVLAKTHSDIHLAIAGEGPERARLTSLAERLGIADRVTLLGLQRDVSPYYDMADVVVLPSHSEGSPNVLFEAMTAGCAIVATRVGGVPEIVVNNETALLVEKQSPASLAEAIARLLADRDLRIRLGVEAKRVAERDFFPQRHPWESICLGVFWRRSSREAELLTTDPRR
jgi:glycosyltransferase involved in cell wall biosynthesis